MSGGEVAYLILVVVSAANFGGVLFWASMKSP